MQDNADSHLFLFFPKASLTKACLDDEAFVRTASSKKTPHRLRHIDLPISYLHHERSYDIFHFIGHVHLSNLPTVQYP